jgi:hypothetical protein
MLKVGRLQYLSCIAAPKVFSGARKRASQSGLSDSERGRVGIEIMDFSAGFDAGDASSGAGRGKSFFDENDHRLHLARDGPGKISLHPLTRSSAGTGEEFCYLCSSAHHADGVTVSHDSWPVPRWARITRRPYRSLYNQFVRYKPRWAGAEERDGMEEGIGIAPKIARCTTKFKSSGSTQSEWS